MAAGGGEEEVYAGRLTASRKSVASLCSEGQREREKVVSR
jgi:hypothetical protein